MPRPDSSGGLRVGAPLPPPPTDLEEVMVGVQEPTELLLDPDDVIESTGALGNVSQWTSPEAQKAGRNFIQHNHREGGAKRTMYDAHGDSHSIDQMDVPMLLATSERFLRCPLCKNMPNLGVHAHSGPNACPARPPRKFMPCPICLQHGNNMAVWEDASPGVEVAEADTSDPNYVAPKLPSIKNREERLQHKLELHMRAFHGGEAESIYGLRRRVEERT